MKVIFKSEGKKEGQARRDYESTLRAIGRALEEADKLEQEELKEIAKFEHDEEMREMMLGDALESLRIEREEENE